MTRRPAGPPGTCTILAYSDIKKNEIKIHIQLEAHTHQSNNKGHSRKDSRTFILAASNGGSDARFCFANFWRRRHFGGGSGFTFRQ
jgi:hypothetical protein